MMSSLENADAMELDRRGPSNHGDKRQLAKMFLICSSEFGKREKFVVPAKAGTQTPQPLDFAWSSPMTTEASYYVYILASGHHGTLYIGVTSNLYRRLG
jgi:hypothetical protein